MAQPTNTFDTYDSVGEREDLSDVIYSIAPTDTPFLSSAAKTQATAVLHEWQTDSLAAAVTNNAVIEGDEATLDASTATESQLKDVIKSVWNAGGDPSMIMCGPFNKQKLSGFTGNSTRFDAGADATLYTSVDVYASDFGQLQVVPNRFSRDRDAYVLDMEYWGIAFLRDFSMHELAKTGDSEKRQLLVEATLESRNEAASGLIADLTTA